MIAFLCKQHGSLHNHLLACFTHSALDVSIAGTESREGCNRVERNDEKANGVSRPWLSPVAHNGKGGIRLHLRLVSPVLHFTSKRWGNTPRQYDEFKVSCWPAHFIADLRFPVVVFTTMTPKCVYISSCSFPCSFKLYPYGGVLPTIVVDVGLTRLLPLHSCTYK